MLCGIPAAAPEDTCRIPKSSEIGCWRRWGASEIARRLGVSRQFVYQVRDRLLSEGEREVRQLGGYRRSVLSRQDVLSVAKRINRVPYRGKRCASLRLSRAQPRDSAHPCRMRERGWRCFHIAERLRATPRLITSDWPAPAGAKSPPAGPLPRRCCRTPAKDAPWLPGRSGAGSAGHNGGRRARRCLHG